MHKTSPGASASVRKAVDAIYAGLKAAQNVLAQGEHLELTVAISPLMATFIRQQHDDAEEVLAHVGILGEADCLAASKNVIAQQTGGPYPNLPTAH